MAWKSKARQIRRGAHPMSAELETRVLRKITLRIVPFVMLLYFIAFIDRVNIGFAALTMNKELGFSPAVFGFGAGIFPDCWCFSPFSRSSWRDRNAPPRHPPRTRFPNDNSSDPIHTDRS